MFALVQNSNDVNNNTGTLDLTLSATVAGNLVVVHSNSNPKGTETLDSVTDDKGNTYVVLPVVDNAYGHIYQAYGMQIVGGVTTVTLHFSNPSDHRAFANEWSGFVDGSENADVYDDSQTGSGSGTDLGTTTLVPDAKGELIVATMGSDNTVTWTAGTNYTLDAGAGNPLSVMCQYKLFGTLAEGGGATQSASINWSERITAFKNGSPITFDAFTETTPVNPGTSQTFSHTCTGTNRALVVGALGDTSADDINSVTYNGVAMSKIDTVQVPSNRYINIWLLLNPASGAHDVVITADTSHYIEGKAISYTGCKQTGGADSHANATGSSVTSKAVATTTIADGALLVMFGKGNAADTAAGANTIERTTTGNLEEFDSSVGRSPEGSNSLNITCSSQNVGYVILSLAPITSVAYTKEFTETITLTETFSRAFTRPFALETITLTETFRRAFTKTFIETPITLTETFFEVLRVIVLGFATETITLTETFARAFTKLYAETITLTEVFGRALTKLYSETITLTETFRRAFTRLWSEQVSLTETFAKSRFQFKSFVESSINLTEVFTRNIGKTFSETITLTEKFSRFLNGILITIWTPVRKVIVSWVKSAKVTDLWTKEPKP